MSEQLVLNVAVKLDENSELFNQQMNNLTELYRRTSPQPMMAESQSVQALKMPNVWTSKEDFYMDTPTAMSMLAMRCKWGFFSTQPKSGNYSCTPFEFVAAHESKEKVFVMIVKDGQSVTLEDELGLYPSDRLVGQIKMLEQGKLP